jgi:hypothetical protein
MKLWIHLILAFFVFLLSCEKQKTIWSSNWAIPLVRDTLDLSNQINDSTLSVNSSGYLEVDLTRTVLDLGINDLLQIPDTTIEQSFHSSLPVINIPPGFTIVNEIEEHQLNFKEIQLKKIRLSKGEIDIVVFNPIPTKCIFTVRMPGVTKNGIVLEKQFTAEAAGGNGSAIVKSRIDLSGYEIDLTGLTGSKFNVLQSLLIVSTDPTGSSVVVNSSQQFKTQASFHQLQLDYARGYFGNKIISDTASLFLTPFQKILSGSIDLPSPDLKIDLINGLKIGARATISSLWNINAMKETTTLTGTNIGVPFYVNEASGNEFSFQPSSTSIDFNGTNSSIDAYLENLGSKHELGYKLELNPWGNISGGYNEIFPNSRLKIRVRAQMPLSIGADGLTLQDTFNIDLSQNRDKTHVSEGSLVLKASNTFPISAGAVLFLLDENNVLLHTVNNANYIHSGMQGIFDPISGLYKKDTELIYTLSESVFKDLNRIKKIVVKTEFNTPDNTGSNIQTAISAGSFLAIKLTTRFVLNTVF